MKKLITNITIVCLLAGIALFTACKPTPVVEPSRLPQDVKQSCTITDSAFNTWFAGGKAAENGLVLPVNSLTFPHNNNCDFYKWSEQMFLWITSPLSGGKYGSGNTVLESPVFFNVSPSIDSAGDRKLIPHTPGTLMRVMNHINQKGPNKLPVIMDKAGNMFEVEEHSANQKQMVKDETGNLVEIDHVETDATGQVSFVSKSGKGILKPKPILEHKLNQSHIVKEFKLASGKSILLDTNGNQVESEEFQATQDGLIAQNGSLVYYLILVNDVYAYYLSGVRANALNGSKFPTTQGSLDSILTFAKNNQLARPPDSNALAIELKTSWVEAKSLKDPQNYFTVDAIIPTYDTSNPNKWVPNGEKTVKLALIGMHIVGSADNHPEMIWATFEHKNNAPNATYNYLDSNNHVKTVAQDTGTGWLLSSNAADTLPNKSHIGQSPAGGDTLFGKHNFPVSASNTLRTKPWGSAPDVNPNAEDTSSAAANSEVISINNSINKLLVGNDLRKNYLLIGATWTFGGNAPNGNSYPYPVGSTASVNDAIGTSQLANSTMETYFQHGKKFTTTGSCFFCHSNNSLTNPSFSPDVISHVFSNIESLPLQKMIREEAKKKK